MKLTDIIGRSEGEFDFLIKDYILKRSKTPQAQNYRSAELLDKINTNKKELIKKKAEF